MSGSPEPLANSPDGAVQDLRRRRGEHLIRTLAVRCPGCRLRFNHNAKTMLSLRGGRQGGSVVSVHVGLLDHEEALADLPAWVAANGRRITPRLRQALQVVWRDQRRVDIAAEQADFPALEAMPSPFDLEREFIRIHATWFARLPRPPVRWGRNSPQRTLSSIRFACYRRRPIAEIVVNPRLARPWVPKVFVEHVLYHELCHHAQACAPIRGEPPHSRRFREWEAQYPHHDLAVTWERLHLERFLQKDDG